jgi:hypothetical protein
LAELSSEEQGVINSDTPRFGNRRKLQSEIVPGVNLLGDCCELGAETVATINIRVKYLRV